MARAFEQLFAIMLLVAAIAASIVAESQSFIAEALDERQGFEALAPLPPMYGYEGPSSSSSW